MGPGIWIVMSELFPTRIRGRAMSIATVSLWSACLLITLTFLSLVKMIGAAGTFWLYALMCAATVVFVWRFTPETRGKTLEEIEREWLWPGTEPALPKSACEAQTVVGSRT